MRWRQVSLLPGAIAVSEAHYGVLVVHSQAGIAFQPSPWSV
jgi:hypothetical protein